MTDPARLFDESSDELELALLRAGCDVSASPGLREKTLAALGLGGAVIVSGAAVGGGLALAAGASGKGAGGLFSLLSLKVATLVAGAAIGVAVPLYHSSDKAPAPSAPLSKPRAVTGSAPRATTPIAQPVAPALPLSASAARVPLPSPPSPRPTTEALRAELAQLDAARSRLTSGDPDAALRLLDAYARSSPRGRLRLEAEVLRIDALTKSGRSAQAKVRARAFLSRYPTSVLAARVRRIAGE